MPWQQSVVDVALELDDDGQFAYDTVVVTVMRQQGKTTKVRAVNLTRPMLARNQVAIYTAQSALDARKKWESDWIPAVQASPLASRVRTVLAPGREAMWFPAFGSRLGIVATTEQAGHGDVIDQGTIDEAFVLEDARVEQSMRPAMSTRGNPDRDYLGRWRGEPGFDGPMMGAQLWLPSTAGTLGRPKGVYLWDYVQRGREAVAAGLNRGLCYIEYSAPMDADPSDPATWRACMPALGYTVTEKVVAAAQKSMKPSEFARAFLNQWLLAGEDPIVPLDVWQLLARPDAPRPAEVVLGLDVGPHDSSAAIVAAGLVPREGDDPAIQCAVLDAGDGTHWLFEALGRHVGRLERPLVTVDERQCRHLIPELERVVGFENVRVLGASDQASACAFWLRRVGQRRVWHRGEQELSSAIVGAAQRSLLDGWAWSRTKSSADITSLVAMSNAVSFWMGDTDA